MKNHEILKKRSNIIKKIREFFDEKGYVEVDTPILAQKVIPESSIKLLKTVGSIMDNNTDYYLLPSPEYYIKQLISDGFDENIYQITKCFRNNEIKSNIHLNEFTMLEYYTLDYDYVDTLNLTKKLFDYIGVSQKIVKRDIFDMFMQYAGVNLTRVCESADPLSAIKSEIGSRIEHSDSDTFDDVFNKILISKVEPQIARMDNFVAIINYPSPLNSLAKTEGVNIQRWELFYKGVEVCNCYSEETSKFALDEYFKIEIPKIEDRASADLKYVSKVSNMPKVSGNAIGIDRLIMCMLDADDIRDVIY